MTQSVHAQEALVFSVLAQLILMIGLARIGHVLARRAGQPGVIGEIVAGLALGPSLLGHVAPDLSHALFAGPGAPAVGVISQIGLVLLMFQIGADFEFGLLRTEGRRTTALAVAAASVAVPFILGVCFGAVSHATLAPQIHPVAYSLFCGVAVAITAVPILGRILREFGLTGHPIGVIAISAAAVNDLVGWLLLAGISAYAAARLDGMFVAWRLGGLILGAIAFRWLLQPAIARLLRALPVQEGRLNSSLLATALCLMFALGLATNAIGIFTIFGGFAAGLLFHHDRAFVHAWRSQVSPFVLVFFLPVFFTYTGLRTNLLGLGTPDIGWLALVLVISIAGKVAPVYAAARGRGLDHWHATLLGVLMNTRALMELIVLNVGYDLGVLPQKVFTMLVVMAVVTTVMTGPLLRVVLPRLGLSSVRVEA